MPLKAASFAGGWPRWASMSLQDLLLAYSRRLKAREAAA